MEASGCRPLVRSLLYFSDDACTAPIMQEDTECSTAFALDQRTNAIHRRTSTPAVLTDGNVYFPRADRLHSSLGRRLLLRR